MPADRAQAFSDVSKTLTSNNIYMVSTLTNLVADSQIKATAAFVNSALCGGLNMTGMPVCTTTFSNHREAVVKMEYMTDGTTASIAQKDVRVRAYLDQAPDLNLWAYEALDNILGSGVQVIPLPSPVPAMMSPLLWWTTADLMAIDPALLEAGLETTYTILFRAGVQRTYSTEGQKCIRNVVDDGHTTVTMLEYGHQAASAALIIQVGFFFFWL